MKTIGLILTMIFFFFCTAVFAQEKENKADANGVYITVEVMPEFLGGVAGFQEYILKNVKYPEQAKKDSITGKVYVQFIISETGKVSDAKVLKSANPLLDAEALRVILSMPDWTPGKQKGAAVKVSYTVPIMFALK